MTFAIICRKLTVIVIFAYISSLTIPYLGFFPYADTLNHLDLPRFIKSFANFDGLQYLMIARDGYMTYQQAYFPLYPILIRVVGDLLRIDYFYSGLLISNIGFGIGLHYFYKLLRIDFDHKKSLMAILFLILFPTSFYFQLIYTEGLFFALLISFLYFLRKGNLKTALIISMFLSATRLIGVFSIIFLLPVILERSEESRGILRSLRSLKDNKKVVVVKWFSGVLEFWRSGVLLLIPLFGLAIYMLYLWQTTSDPLFFFNSQPAFGANRSTHMIFLPQVYYRYFKMLFTAAFNWQYVIALLEFISFTFVAGILAVQSYVILERAKRGEESRGILRSPSGSLQDDEKSIFLLTLNIFSWINIVLPTLTGTFSSVPRYALFSISIFYFLANMKNKFVQYSLLTIFATLQIILFAFFIQGYFIA